ncbi:MAG: PDZ domain-containing protein [Paenibacillaceae bacterium]
MEFILELLKQLVQAVGQLLLSPFYYLGFVIIVLQYRRQIELERKLFHTRLHSIIHESWRMLLWGWLCGIVASLLMAFIGASLQMNSVYLLWIISLILLLFRVRYLNVAYSAGILGILHSIVGYFPEWIGFTSYDWFFGTLDRLHVPSLLVIVAITHLLEANLLRFQGKRLASPTLVAGKRGKLVGGYQLQSYWPVPLFLLIPVTGGTLDLPWAPLFSSGLDAAANGSWGFVALPVILGFTSFTQSRFPADKIRQSSSLLILYACIILISAVLSYYWSFFVLVASLLTILLHEALVFYNEWQESRQSPLFVHNVQGLKILAVIPGSSAAELGLQAGEIIHKVNSVAVRTKQELHQAMQINPAFCRLEVINSEGYSKFVSRAIYAGEHHELGILLAPDADTIDFIGEKQRHMHFLHALRGKRKE